MFKTGGQTMKLMFAGLLLGAAIVTQVEYARSAEPPPDISHLIQQLRDPDLDHRRDAARELGKISPLPPEGINVMASLLEQQNQDYVIQNAAFNVLCNDGVSAVSVATRLAHSTDRSRSQQGLALLECLAPRAKDVWPILIGIYKQNPAGNAIEKLAAAGRPVLPLMFEAVKNGDPAMRSGAILTIYQIIGKTHTMTPEYNALHHFVPITPDDLAPAKAEFAAALHDPNPRVRNAAAVALNYADPKDQRPLRILTDLVSERNVEFIGAAVQGLKDAGSVAKPAVPALEHVLAADSDVVLQWQAASALAQIEGQGACAALERAIVTNKDWRDGFVPTIVAISPPCPRLIPTLIETFRDEREYANLSRTIMALANIGPAAVPALAASLKSPNLYVRQNAAETLAAMKPLPPDAVRALRYALQDRNSDVRDTATSALRTVGGEAQRDVEAAEKREQQAATETPKLDTHIYTHKQIMAQIPADDEYMYPQTLHYIFPVTKGPAADAKLFLTVHSGKDRPDRLAIWKKLGPDSYQQETEMHTDDILLDDHYERPFTFSAKYDHVTDKSASQREGFFFDVPISGWRRQDDNIFVVDGYEAIPVELDSHYPDWLGGNFFRGGKLEFSENVYDKYDPTCCPTGGEITGTYKIVEDTTKTPSLWKIVVATTTRVPPPSTLSSEPPPTLHTGSHH